MHAPRITTLLTVCVLLGGCGPDRAAPASAPPKPPLDREEGHRIAPEGAPFSMVLPASFELDHSVGPSGVHSILGSSDEGVVAILWLDHRTAGRELRPDEFDAFALAPLSGMTSAETEAPAVMSRNGALSGTTTRFRAGEEGELRGMVVVLQLPGWLLAVMVGGLQDSRFAPGGAGAAAIVDGIDLARQDHAPNTELAIHDLMIISAPVFKDCYQRRLEARPELSGTLLLDIRFGATGQIERCAIAGDSALRDRELETCVLAEARRWEIPAPVDGNPVEFRYPLHFQP